MGGANSKDGKGFNPAERSGGADSGFNSLVEDQHVDPKAQESMGVFNQVKDEVKKLKLTDIKIRGIKLE